MVITQVKLYREHGAIGAATHYTDASLPLDSSFEFLGLGNLIPAHVNRLTGATIPAKIVGPVAVSRDLQASVRGQ